MLKCIYIKPNFYNKGSYDITKFIKYIISDSSFTLSWEVVSYDESNRKLVIKNTSGIVNYEPHLIIQEVLDSNSNPTGKIEFFPCKTYDSSIENNEQEGAINNNGNTYTFYINLKLNQLITSNVRSIIFTDYNFIINGNNNNNFYFEIFKNTSPDYSGMYLKTEQNEYLYYNGIWYGKTSNSVYNKIFKINIEKSKYFYHLPSPKGEITVSPKSFFIDVSEDDTTPPLWQNIGVSQLLYTKELFYEYLTTVVSHSTYNNSQKNLGDLKHLLLNYAPTLINTNDKLCYILGRTGLVFFEDEIQIRFIKDLDLY